MARISFENEFILHLLTQKHLKCLFGLECLGCEIQKDGLRLDNMDIISSSCNTSPY